VITLTAASGATYNLGYAPISLAELYFGETVHPAVAIFFMWGIVWTGYSFAAIARQFLIYDPQYPWFQALCQTALFETQKKQREAPTPVSRKQTKVFWLVLGGIILWQFLPEFAFPMLGSLACKQFPELFHVPRSYFRRADIPQWIIAKSATHPNPAPRVTLVS
jgi:hypothetical protein